MRDLDSLDRDDDDSDTVFRDTIMLALAGFVSMVILMLPHLHPRSQAAQEGSTAPGNVIVEVRWPDSLDSDVDLWVQAPGDIPVGYSNKGGAVFNLLRDDLGRRGDATDMNYEVSYSRGIIGGEYTVNVHLYRNSARTYPIPITVVTSVKKTAEESARQILTTKVNLEREGEEVTAYRFKLDADGNLEPGSVHSLFRGLRSWRKMS
ncbi:hypothetical protein [Marinivivus vitaminiproducens]|uniref:hypothetical protein n=1 Tax=Marinivivus vitaminiproducens TaxID=3035935 RepID=UPI00279B6614|nr:hypothetical protein P4R82_12210 [Geminicoccaceae bacterium SCSIO 64248]